MDIVKVTSSVKFKASVDHSTVVGGINVVDKYMLLVTEVASGTIRYTKDLGKPTPDAAGDITAPFGWTAAQFNALPQGTYTFTTSAVGPGGSTISPASDPFGVLAAPAAPGKGIVIP